MSGGFDVTPSELHQAGATLRGVRSELSVGDGLGAGSVGDVGYPDLAQAIGDISDDERQITERELYETALKPAADAQRSFLEAFHAGHRGG
jgi:hypothetical protein